LKIEIIFLVSPSLLKLHRITEELFKNYSNLEIVPEKNLIPRLIDIYREFQKWWISQTLGTISSHLLLHNFFKNDFGRF